jgi:hypothetical protein
MDWKNFDKVFDSWDPIWSLWPRNRFDWIAASRGIAVGIVLTTYAYYAALRGGVPGAMLGFYIVLFFPSMIEVHEQISAFVHGIIIVTELLINGAIYVAVSRSIRSN